MGALSPSGDYLRTCAGNGVTVGRCVYCQHIIGAAKEIAKVEIAENIHECLGKHEEAGELPPKKPVESDRQSVSMKEPEARNPVRKQRQHSSNRRSR